MGTVQKATCDIAPAYHTAARRSLRAFPTSPTKCVLTEAGLPSIEERVTQATSKLTSKLLFSYNPLLQGLVKNTIIRKKERSRKSTVERVIDTARALEIPITQYNTKYTRPPPWQDFESFVLLDMAKRSKHSTSTSTFRKIFLVLTSSFRETKC